MTKRVFTYGCSVTQHIWPTWADIVLHSARINCYSVFNAGRSGIGNTGIKRSVIQTHEKYDITEEDTLLVMWTSWLREDRLTQYDTLRNPKDVEPNSYVTHTRCGNVLNTPFYTDRFIRDYFNLDHYIINSISEITAVRKAFALAYEGSIAIGEGISDAHSRNVFDNSLTKGVYAAFNSDLHMPNPYVVSDIHNKYSEYAPYYVYDGHPVPAHALDYVQQSVEPHLPFAILPETIEWVDQWNRLLLSLLTQYGAGGRNPDTINFGNNTHQWHKRCQMKMDAYNKDNGITTHSDIWGGTDSEPDAVDTLSILKTFVDRNKKG